MIIVAVDVAKDKHDCFITNTDGEVLFDSFIIRNDQDGFDDLYEDKGMRIFSWTA